MKHGRKPTMRQKLVISSHGYNAENWLIVKNQLHENKLEIVHKETGTVRVIKSA